MLTEMVNDGFNHDQSKFSLKVEVKGHSYYQCEKKNKTCLTANRFLAKDKKSFTE